MSSLDRNLYPSILLTSLIASPENISYECDQVMILSDFKSFTIYLLFKTIGEKKKHHKFRNIIRYGAKPAKLFCGRVATNPRGFIQLQNEVIKEILLLTSFI